MPIVVGLLCIMGCWIWVYILIMMELSEQGKMVQK